MHGPRNQLGADETPLTRRSIRESLRISEAIPATDDMRIPSVADSKIVTPCMSRNLTRNSSFRKEHCIVASVLLSMVADIVQFPHNNVNFGVCCKQIT
jgi:hypothetical protein